MLQAHQINLVCDVHGLAAHHELDINIGSAGFFKPQLVKDLAEDLADASSVAVGNPYNGGDSITGMVNRSTTLEVSAIQLEFGPRLRSDTTDTADLRTLAAALGRFEEAFLRVH